MKILRTREEAQKQKISREKANEGCYVCPSCGCDKVIDIFDSMETQEKGIVRVTFNTSEKGFFKTKYGVVDHFNKSRISSCTYIHTRNFSYGFYK